MSYNKRTWANGNVVGAVDLNRIENGIADIDVDEIRGWGVQETQLFSETVTTTDQEGVYATSFAYVGAINSATIVVTFNGTEYTCQRTEPFTNVYAYGGFAQEQPNFSEYPFAIMSNRISSSEWANSILTETAGTYMVTVSTTNIEISDTFNTVANKAVEPNLSTLPLLCVSGETTYSEIDTAYDAQRLMYFTDANLYGGYNYYIITFADAQRGTITFYPENASINVSLVNDVFTVVEAVAEA